MTTSWVSAETLDPKDLNDVSRLLAADTEGWLRGAASAGSAVRAVAAAVQEGELARLHGNTVRSVVLVAPHGPARQAALLLQAMFGGVSSVPVLQADRAPRWVGPLDVVVVATDDPGSQELAESVAMAVGRGAEVVLAVPAEGLLVPAARGRALLVPPRVRVPQGLGMLRFVAVGLAVLAELAVAPTPDLAALADELDAEAERNQAGGEVFTNPAKSLALRCAERRLVIVGDSPACRVLAAHFAASLLARAGVVAASAELDEVLAQSHRDHQRAQRRGATTVVDPIFHDPDIDGPLPVAPLRVLLLATKVEEHRLQVRSSGLAGIEIVVGGVESGALREDTVTEVLVLAARCESAAVYLGLAS